MSRFYFWACLLAGNLKKNDSDTPVRKSSGVFSDIPPTSVVRTAESNTPVNAPESALSAHTSF